MELLILKENIIFQTLFVNQLNKNQASQSRLRLYSNLPSSHSTYM